MAIGPNLADDILRRFTLHSIRVPEAVQKRLSAIAGAVKAALEPDPPGSGR
jgi:actin-like ATPase involved in cell morphogenesis